MKVLSRGRYLVFSAVLTLAFLAPGLAQESVPASASETSQLWFVELGGAPVADGNSVANVRREKDAFRLAALREGLRFRERRAFDTLWNGLSIEISASQVGALSRVPGVKAIYPVVKMTLPPVNETPDLATALAMTGADIAQSELGFTGKGVKVGVIDTGIDYRHPDLGGCFGPGCRVAVGYDFVGDAFNADLPNPTLVPDPDPEDCAGHGTHVAGIIGAKGIVTGVAPGVTFGAYRVFGCLGSTTADVMIAAMERALADKMQVVNMSIGSAYQWPQYPTAIAADRLVNKGVVVVASIGNEGANGLYSAGAPGIGKNVIGTASFDNTYTNLNAFSISPDDRKVGYIQATAAPPAPLSGAFTMARTGTTTTAADACTALSAGSLAGKVVLIRRGTCSFYVKSFNAQAAGAVGVVLYNNTSGLVSATVAGTPPIKIPVVGISQADGALIDGRIAGGPVTMTWTAQIASAPNPTGGLISSFSSYGLAPDLSLKPDIGAPGGLIRSTYPLALGGYANLSGTSMSSPHVAGAAALLLEAEPRTSSKTVRDILQNSALPKNWWGLPTSGLLDNVHRQGAGMVQIDKAILATTEITPGKLELGEGQAGPATRTLSVENKSGSVVTYALSYTNALSTGGVITPSFSTSNASVAFGAPSVSVPARGTATVNVTVNPATGPLQGQYGGYIVFTPQGGGQVYRVPFAGFVGDYQSIQVLTPAGYGFPWLAKVVGSNLVNQPSGAIFTLIGGDIPYFVVHFDHQSRLLRVEVFDAVSGRAWHRIYNEDYMSRNSTPTAFFALPWDGLTTSGNKTWTVPNGRYIVKLSILKALGEDSNPADWETWTSPVITLARP